jgi:hypothetical protein
MIFQIIQYVGKEETFFFDWLVSNSFNDVTKVFRSHDRPEDILGGPESFSVLRFKRDKVEVKFNNLDATHSVHDVTRSSMKDSMELLLGKYKRRMKRTIDLVRGSDRLFFFRLSSDFLSNAHKENFDRAIMGINENCDYKLFCLYNKCEEDSVSEDGKFVEIRLRNDDPESDDWRLFHLNWDLVFDTAVRISDSG